MRMWNIPPSKMCDQHLLGKHVECHMFVGTLNQGKSVEGYLNNGLLEIHNLRKRHDRLAREMQMRGMNHESPLSEFREVKIGKINSKQNKIELNKRCKECRKR